jgi:hypothetical protein
VSRCQLQYLHPQLLTWVNCTKKASVLLALGSVHREVCPEHGEEVLRVRRAGLADQLRWTDKQVPRQRPSRTPAAQLSLL